MKSLITDHFRRRLKQTPQSATKTSGNSSARATAIPRPLDLAAGLHNVKDKYGRRRLLEGGAEAARSDFARYWRKSKLILLRDVGQKKKHLKGLFDFLLYPKYCSSSSPCSKAIVGAALN